jgi:anthranilate/para-aminobenzoate synthase component I
MDFNIAIRTMTVQGDRGTYPVGGGIVWDSVPLDEWQEAQQKSEIFAPYKYKPATEQTDLESASLTY